MVICGADLFVDERGVIISYQLAYQLAGVREQEEVLVMCLFPHTLTYCPENSNHVNGAHLCQCGYIEAIPFFKQL